MKKSVLSLLLGLVATAALAGTEDWVGNYTILDNTGGTKTVIHAPNYVRFLFMQAGSCMRLGKSSSINGMKPTDDTNLCSQSNIQTFTNEVEKLGIITNKTITRGSTYTD